MSKKQSLKTKDEMKQINPISYAIGSFTVWRITTLNNLKHSLFGICYKDTNNWRKEKQV